MVAGGNVMPRQPLYSYRRAASGLSRAALRAGNTPNATPTNTETTNAIGAAIPGTTNGM